MASRIKLECQGDEFYIPEIREWTTKKYRLVANYMDMFSKGMKNKWDKRVYIDLFAGAGKSRYKENKKIFKGSPFLALDVEYKFDKYIFCEETDIRTEALRERIHKYYPEVDIDIIHGDCNQKVDEIISKIPSGRKVLSLCLVDPNKLSSLKFQTLMSLSNGRRMDFMMLYPSNMEIRRWPKLYLEEDNKAIEAFLNIKEWRKEWYATQRSDSEFVKFIAEKFGQQMIKVGYLKKGLDEMVEIKMIGGKRSLYHIAFYSKNELGYKFWKAADTYRNVQININY